MEFANEVDFEAWVSFAKLESSKSALADVGIEAMEDLKDVCCDSSLTITLRGALSAQEFNKFVAAVKNTRFLKGTRFCSEIQSITSTNTTTASSSSTASLDAEIAALKRQIASMQVNSTTVQRVADLNKKLRDAENTKTVLLETSRNNLYLNQRRRMLSGMEDKLRQAASLDICFALDCTGSMGSHIAAARDHIHRLTTAIVEFYPDVPLRLAFVGYRDHCDGDKRLAVLRFTNDVASFKSFVNAQPATGGGDSPEDVFGALSVVIGLDWQAATRLFFHIGDAPCHGRAYHSCDDSYPDGDPNGLKAERLIPDLQAKKIHYQFGRMNSSTDQMIRMFNQIARKDYIANIDVGDSAKMMEKVSMSVTTSLYTSVSGSASTDGVHEKINVVLDSSEPTWGSLRSENVHRFAMKLPSSLSSLLSGSDTTFVEAVPTRCAVKVSPRPFGAGGVRAAYKVQQGGSYVVHKVPLSKKSRDAVRERFESVYISSHCAAAFLAREFMKVRPPTYPGVRYADLALIQYMERTGTPYCTEESLLSGTFEKYNNNSGMVLVNPSPISGANHEVVQAFSHWTFHITSGKMMVVNCQGVFNRSDNCFILTNPAINCADIGRFGGTNMAEFGIRRFRKTHKCNACCRQLGLASL